MPTIQEELLKAVQKIIEQRRKNKLQDEWDEFYAERADRYKQSVERQENNEYHARWPGKGENC
jgi:hemoglobin-like flavoprotein